MTFFRIILAGGIIGAIYTGLTDGWWDGLIVFLSVGVLVWVGLTLLDLFGGLRNALRRPNVNVYVNQERHPDPTRPDDEHPLIVLGDQQYRRRK